MNAIVRYCPAFALAVLAGCGGGAYAPDSTLQGRGFAYVTSLSGTVSVHPLDGVTAALGGARSAAPAGASPLAIAAHPSGAFLYVANFFSCDLTTYATDAAGTLQPIGERIATAAGFNPIAIAVHPSGRFAYVTTLLNNPSPALVLPYGIDSATGALTRLGAGAFAGATPSAIAIAPGGRFAYVTDSVSDAVWSFVIDVQSGLLRNIAPDAPLFPGFGPASIAIDRTGRFVYVANLRSNTVSAFAADAASGALTPIGEAVATGAQPSFVAVHPSSRFVYVSNTASGDISMYQADSVTGVLSSLGTVRAGSRPKAVAFDESGRRAFVVNAASDDLSVFTVDIASGLLIAAGPPVSTGAQPTAIVTVGGLTGRTAQGQ